VRDLRSLLWCSIDNDDSRDLDQLTFAEPLGDGRNRICVAVADVDAVVKLGTPIDQHAQKNTTSVYTAAQIFSMLPERLSTDLTSLNEHEERVAMVIDMTVSPDGEVVEGTIYRGLVYNQAKLAYNSVGAWLEGQTGVPEKVAAVSGLAENLKLQDRMPTPCASCDTSTARSISRPSSPEPSSRTAASSICRPRRATTPRT